MQEIQNKTIIDKKEEIEIIKKTNERSFRGLHEIKKLFSFKNIKKNISLIHASLRLKLRLFLNSFLKFVKGNFFIGFVSVILANIFFLSGIETTLDLTIGKDALSLINSFNQNTSEILNSGANSGYLYTLFLKIISYFSSDVIDAYYFNIFSLSLLSTLMIYVYSYVITGRTINSMLLSFFWLICCFNVTLYEKDTLFALIFIITGFLASEISKSSSLKLIILSSFLFFASYISEAYFFPFAITLGLGTVILGKNIKQRYKEIPALLFVFLLIFIAQNKGLPFLSDKDASFMNSFKECFFLNWQNWQEISAAKLYDENYKDFVWLSTFGDTNNIFKAFLASPLTLLHHLFTNFIGTLQVIGINLFYHYPIFSPTNSFRSIVVEGMIFIIAFLSLLGGALEHNETRDKVIKRHGFRMILWSVTLISPIISGIVFFPYPYYVVQLGCFFLIFGGIFVAEILHNMDIKFLDNKKSLLIFSFCMLCVVPRVYTMPPKTDILVNSSRIFGKSYATLPIKETVSFIKSLNISSNIDTFSIENGYTHYLPNNYTHFNLPYGGFKQALRERKIDMVIETSGFATSPKDKELLRFLRTPEKFGYFVLKVPGLSENRIIIRDGIACDNSLCKKRITNLSKEKKKELPIETKTEDKAKSPLASNEKKFDGALKAPPSSKPRK